MAEPTACRSRAPQHHSADGGMEISDALFRGLECHAGATAKAILVHFSMIGERANGNHQAVRWQQGGEYLRGAREVGCGGGRQHEALWFAG